MSLEINKREDIKIGYWYSYCCHHDLYEIKEDDQISKLFEDVINWMSPDIWKTRLSALLEIREGWEDKDEFEMIDDMIETLI